MLLSLHCLACPNLNPELRMGQHPDSTRNLKSLAILARDKALSLRITNDRLGSWIPSDFSIQSRSNARQVAS